MKLKQINIIAVIYVILSMPLSVLAGDAQHILITVKHTGKEDAAVLRSMNRNYVPPARYGSELQVKRTVKAIAHDYALDEVGDAWSINILDVYCALLAIPSNQQINSVIAQLSVDERIESVQPLYQYSVQGQAKQNTYNPTKNTQAALYNDPYFSLQYRNRQALVAEMHEALTGDDVVIAVIDTGADTNHIDLVDQISVTKNFVDDDKIQFSTDIHGTAIAGIIAAKPDNELGIVGLAPDAELWILKACWQIAEKNSVAQCNSFTLANALSVGIDENIDIFNISLSGPRDPLIERLITAAIQQGITVVAADPLNSSHRYPALLPGVVGVYEQPAVNDVDLEGIPEQMAVQLNGQEILTTVPNDGFDFLSGSSMSTAMVSALSALLLQRDGEFNFVELNKLVHHMF